MQTTRHKNRNLIFLSLALVLLVALLLPIFYDYYYAIPVEVERGNERFGLNFISPPDHLADEARYEGALAAGAAWDRWPLYWHWVAAGGYVGPHQGGLHDYDSLVTQEIERGLKPLVILMGTPADEAVPANNAGQVAEQAPGSLPLRANPLEISSATLPPRSLYEPIFLDGGDEPGAGQAINPANGWANFVYSSVERYRPGGSLAQTQDWPAGAGVRHWEIWNEPDFRQFWGGTVADYYRLLEVAYKSIKSADPEATVLLGGLAFYEQPNWLGQLLQQSGGEPGQAYFDAVSMHHYWSIYKSEARLVELRATLEAYGLEQMPIWLTESGLSVWDDFPATSYDVSPDTPWRATMAEQAAYVIQQAALTLYHGADRYFHFMLHDDCGDGPPTAFGLRQNFSPHACNPAQGQPRPAYAAYQLAAEQFRNLTPLWRQRRAEQDELAFYRPQDRSRVLVIWSTQPFTTTAVITAAGQTAQLHWIDPSSPPGNEEFHQMSSLTPINGRYTLDLPPATNRNNPDPYDPRYHIGGRPYLLVERDEQPPTATITLLAPLGPATYLVKWQGQDTGSGVAGYEVWAGHDDAPLELWQPDTLATQAEFEGEVGHTYHFAVRARDRAGNEAPQPSVSQASTETLNTATIAGVVLGPEREPVAKATVLIDRVDAAVGRSLATQADGTWPPALLLPDDYTVQANAPGYGRWPAARTIHLESPTTLLLTLPPADNVVASGDFEGNEVWRHWDWAGEVDLFFRSFDGQFAARLGEGVGEKVRCLLGYGQRWSIQQRVAIPAESEPVLSFVQKIDAPRPAAGEAWLEVNVGIEGEFEPVVPPGEFWQPADWTLTALDLTPWRGQTVALRFQVIRCSERPFTATLDRVSVGSVTP